MLSLEPSSWQELLTLAEAQRDSFMGDYDEAIRRYVGPYYKTAWNADVDLENHAQEWIALFEPQLAMSNPAVRVRANKLGPVQDRALALQFALNRWIRLTDLRPLNERLVAYYGFAVAVLMVTRDAQYNASSEPEDPKLWPVMTDVDPRCFAWDPYAKAWQRARWAAHVEIRDKDDMIEDARRNPKEGWDVEALEALSLGAEMDRHRRDKPADVRNRDVSYWQVWVPELENDKEHPPEEGWHGKVLTLGIGGGQAKWIRDPYPYWGPRWGPYRMAGGSYVPGQSMPLSPLNATRAQANDLNAISNAISRSAQAYKRLGLVGREVPDLAELFREAPHDSLLSANIEDLGRNYVQVEVGGSTQWMHAYEENARSRLDRNSGIHEAMRGNVEGIATATEVTMAGSGAAVRVQHHIEKFRSLVKHGLMGVAWYLDNDDAIEVELGPEVIGKLIDPDTGELYQQPLLKQPAFRGHPKSTDTFDDYDLEIELYSMGQTPEQSALSRLNTIQTAIQWAGLIPTLPQVDWRWAFQMLGDIGGIPDLADRVYVEEARELGMVQMAAGMAAGGGGVSNAPPKTAGPTPRPVLPRELGNVNSQRFDRQRPQARETSAKIRPQADGRSTMMHKGGMRG